MSDHDHARPDGIEGFAGRVLAVVAATRPGELLTYGEVALEVGSQGAARAVGQVLRARGSQVPWWRVVTSEGRLVPGLEREHERRLTGEGVTCRDGRVRPAHRPGRRDGSRNAGPVER